ncbi:hotdog domain-containing protein [Nonlabens sp.]|uniref:acyl-CoA thioesterase n=1 Tax=Nonlabens sp. TaxID=1888209 RepID=UPI0025F928F0|nr:hotdog domain-containing protein [Nonlabens sp.]
MKYIDKRIKQSRTSIFKAIFPKTTNHHDTLFRGTALPLMDEVSVICAARFSRKNVVTINTDQIEYKKPFPLASIIELVGHFAKVGKTNFVVETNTYIEDMYCYCREKVVTGIFTFVAIGADKKPSSII